MDVPFFFTVGRMGLGWAFPGDFIAFTRYIGIAKMFKSPITATVPSGPSHITSHACRPDLAKGKLVIMKGDKV